MSCRLHRGQLEYLSSVKVAELPYCIKCFIIWIEEGYYNYCDLPIGLKRHLSDTDRKRVESLHEDLDYTGIHTAIKM